MGRRRLGDHRGGAAPASGEAGAVGSGFQLYCVKRPGQTLSAAAWGRECGLCAPAPGSAGLAVRGAALGAPGGAGKGRGPRAHSLVSTAPTASVHTSTPAPHLTVVILCGAQPSSALCTQLKHSRARAPAGARTRRAASQHAFPGPAPPRRVSTGTPGPPPPAGTPLHRDPPSTGTPIRLSPSQPLRGESLSHSPCRAERGARGWEDPCVCGAGGPRVPARSRGRAPTFTEQQQQQQPPAAPRHRPRPPAPASVHAARVCSLRVPLGVPPSSPGPLT